MAVPNPGVRAMTTDSWVVASLGAENVRKAAAEAGRRRLQDTLGATEYKQFSDDQLQFIANALELRVFDLLNRGDAEDLQAAAEEAFQIARVLPLAKAPVEAAQELVRLGCLGVIGERASDVKRLLLNQDSPKLPLDSENWGLRVSSTILNVWLRLLRKNGWEDLDAVQAGVAKPPLDSKPIRTTIFKRSRGAKRCRACLGAYLSIPLGKGC